VRDATRVLTRAALVFITVKTSTKRATIILTQLISSYDGVTSRPGWVRKAIECYLNLRKSNCAPDMCQVSICRYTPGTGLIGLFFNQQFITWCAYTACGSLLTTEAQCL